MFKRKKRIGRNAHVVEQLEARRHLSVSLDTSFGHDGLAYVEAPLGVGRVGDRVTNRHVAFDAQGRILVSNVRLNPDGSLDHTFQAPANIGDDNAVVQPDGKILMTGSTDGPARIYRLMPDGSLDPSFDGDGIFEFSEGRYTVMRIALGPDGKITGIDNQARVFRLNSDGTRDRTFGEDGVVRLGGVNLALQADGKTLVYSGSNVSGLHRLNVDGSLDLNFGRAGEAYDPNVASLVVQGNVGIATDEYFNSAVALDSKGRVLISSRSPTGRASIVRIMPDGVRDATFVFQGYDRGVATRWNAIRPMPDGRILIAGEKSETATRVDFLLEALNPDGTPDETFGPQRPHDLTVDLGGDDLPMAIDIGPDGRIAVGGGQGAYAEVGVAVAVYSRNGTLDPTFGDGGRVAFGKMSGNFSSWFQSPDGKYYAAPNVRAISGYSQLKFPLQRFTADGQVDPSFDPAGFRTDGVYNGVTVVTFGPDGKPVVLASFTPTGSSTSQYKLITFNRNGTVESEIVLAGLSQLQIYSVRAASLQPDGRLIANAGTFGRNVIVRFNSDGMLDTSFGAQGVLNPAGPISTWSQRPDGKFWVATASYSTEAGTMPDALSLYTADGQLDTASASGGMIALAGPIASWSVHPDGKLWVGTNADSTESGSTPASLSVYSTGGELETSLEIGGHFGLPETISLGGLRFGPSRQAYLAAYEPQPGSQSSYLLALKPDASPDAAFGDAGLLDTGGFFLQMVMPDGRLVLTGGERELRVLDATGAVLDQSQVQPGRTLARFNLTPVAVANDNQIIVRQTSQVESSSPSIEEYARYSLYGPSTLSLSQQGSFSAEPIEGEPTPTASFVLRRTGPATDTLDVPLTIGGSATPGVDYTLLPDRVTFAPGERTITLPVNALADGVIERLEDVTASIGTVPGYQTDSDTATINVVTRGEIDYREGSEDEVFMLDRPKKFAFSNLSIYAPSSGETDRFRFKPLVPGELHVKISYARPAFGVFCGVEGYDTPRQYEGDGEFFTAKINSTQDATVVLSASVGVLGKAETPQYDISFEFVPGFVLNVVGRVFNNSSSDGFTPGPDYAGLDRQAKVQVTGSSKGVNGIFFQLTNTPRPLTLDDFEFMVDKGGSLNGWQPAPPPPSGLSIKQEKWTPGPVDFVVVVWEDGAIVNRWLKCRIKPIDGAPVMLAPDVWPERIKYFFGNLVGYSGNGTGPIAVTATDLVRVRNSIGRVGVDVNGDGRTDAADLVLVRNKIGHALGASKIPITVNRPSLLAPFSPTLLRVDRLSEESTELRYIPTRRS